MTSGAGAQMYHIMIPMALALGILASPAIAADPEPFPDFTFKRVKPPQSGATKRITVQIEPARVLPQIAAPALGQPSKTPAGYDWFWDKVPTNGTGPSGVDLAIATLGKAPVGHGVRAPRLDQLRSIADTYGAEILAATIGTKVSPALVLAVISVESGGKIKATSHAGAQGLMQLMPATASRFGVTNSMEPKQNIKGGVKYLDWLMDEFSGDPVLALAGYNAGEGAVRKHGGVPPFAETRGYVPKVMAAFQVARGLCLTPPMLASDGCVFVGKQASTNG